MSVAYLCVTRNRGERPQPLFQQVTCMNKQSAEISAPQMQDIAKKKNALMSLITVLLVLPANNNY